jgi:hypothetical protein
MSKWVLLSVLLFSVVAVGCGGGGKEPEPDPNFTPTTNPSDLTIPDQLKKPGN